MFLLKIMSDQNLSDNDMTKNYKMIAIGSGDQFEFYHDSDTGLPMVQVVPKEGESYSVELTGNAYVVSETGKTVSSHWARTLWQRRKLKTTLGKNVADPEETSRQIQQIVAAEKSVPTTSAIQGVYYSQVLHEGQEPALFNINYPAHTQMYNSFDNTFILKVILQHDDKNDIVGAGIINGVFAVNVNDLFINTDVDGHTTAYTIVGTRPVKHKGECGHYVTFKSLGTLSKSQRDDLDDKTVNKVKQPTTVGALVDAEQARRALLNEANPNPEPKVTYTA